MSALALDQPMHMRQEPGGGRAFLLALAVHVLLFVGLFFGVSWNTQEPIPVMAELWSEFPNVQQQTPQPPQPVPPEPVPQPKPKVDPPPPKPEVKEPPPKPDIALEQERKKRLAEEKVAAEKAAAEKKKAEAEKKKADEDRLRRDMAAAEQKRLRDQLNDVPATPSAPIKGPTFQGDPKAVSASYLAKVVAKIKGQMVQFAVPGNPEAVFKIVQMPDGGVMRVDLVKSSGAPHFDAAVERAIRDASPLPLPAPGERFEREIEVGVRP